MFKQTATHPAGAPARAVGVVRSLSFFLLGLPAGLGLAGARLLLGPAAFPPLSPLSSSSSKSVTQEERVQGFELMCACVYNAAFPTLSPLSSSSSKSATQPWKRACKCLSLCVLVCIMQLFLHCHHSPAPPPNLQPNRGSARAIV